MYLYRLRGLEIDRPGQVYSMDITYIPKARGCVYQAAAIGWYSRKVSYWRASITMNVYFCLEAMEDAIARYGLPDTVKPTRTLSLAHWPSETCLLKAYDIEFNIDGEGACSDKVCVGWLWRSMKYEEVYLDAYDTLSDPRSVSAITIDVYNHKGSGLCLNSEAQIRV